MQALVHRNEYKIPPKCMLSFTKINVHVRQMHAQVHQNEYTSSLKESICSYVLKNLIFKIYNPKCKVSHRVLGVSSTGSWVSSTGISLGVQSSPR